MLLALALTVLLAALAIFQLALALGAPIGRFAWVAGIGCSLRASGSGVSLRS